MDDLRRWVNLSLIFAGMIVWWLAANIAATVLDLVGFVDFRIIGEYVTLSTAIGGVIGFIAMVALWNYRKLYEGLLNVAREMMKVTWPTADETKYATKTVFVATLITAAILSVFDFFFQWLTGLILGVSS